MCPRDFNDDKIVVSKALDTINLSQNRNRSTFYGFLNEHQSQLIKDNCFLSEDCLFFGGYDDAQRVIFGSNVNDVTVFPLVALKFIYKSEYELTHRDFLGSLMALGIERSTIGDILVFKGEAIVFVKSDISDYIKNQISKIGRVGVRIIEQDLDDIYYESEFDILDLTLASLRLDVFVSAICSCSRDKSQRMIKSDLVSVNHKIENNISKTIFVNDIISIRKYGKFVFTGENGFSKKGKHKVTVKHFR